MNFKRCKQSKLQNRLINSLAGKNLFYWWLYCSLYVLYFSSVNIDKQPAKLLFKSQEVSVLAPLMTLHTAGKSEWQHWIGVKLSSRTTWRHSIFAPPYLWSPASLRSQVTALSRYQNKWCRRKISDRPKVDIIWKMPGICCAVGCDSSRQRNPEMQFYSIPKDVERRNKWLAAIRRDHWQPTANSRLCNQHFLSHKSSTLSNFNFSHWKPLTKHTKNMINFRCHMINADTTLPNVMLSQWRFTLCLMLTLANFIRLRYTQKLWFELMSVTN